MIGKRFRILFENGQSGRSNLIANITFESAARIVRPSIRGILRLVKSKILRSSVFAWATLVSVVVSQIMRYGVVGVSAGHFITTASLATSCTLLTALSAYVLNDVSDLKVDSVNSPRRPFVTKAVGKSETITLILFLDFLALLIGATLGIVPFFVVLLELAGGIAYSFRPFSYKSKFVLKTLSIGIAGVVSSVFGALCLGYGIYPLVVYASSMFFVYLFVTSPLNDLGDIAGDVFERRKTIPIVIGSSNTVKLALFAGVIPFVSSLLFFPFLGTNLLMPAIMGFVSLRSVQLLYPLLRAPECLKIREKHRQMVLLH
ncbi:MAG: UbiA family prenyltransferase, partial [Nitrososphaerota archaeon]|nr:UbiA family prenyltransferase [Nitrososphaerota archaeon]